MPPPDSFIVRVLRRDGTTAAGVGTLISGHHFATCAHVVNVALGRDQRAQDRPGGTVRVDFPLLSGGSTVLTASVEIWVPPPTEGAAGDDIAGLRIDGDLPEGAAPARLAIERARRGREVEVFGYPEVPKRPDGARARATVRGPVGNGRLQIDSNPDSAIKIQPGFSGGPVYDDARGLVLGLIGLAPDGSLPDRDSYATAAEQLRLTLSGLLAEAHSASAGRPRERLTILHVSDPRFSGGRDAQPRDDPFFGPLHEDLAALARDHGLRPDLMVVTGNLSEHGRPSEFRRGTEFVGALAEAAGIPRRRVAVVPGDHDVNHQACMAHFADQQGAEKEPIPPYWPKWRFFAEAFTDFYRDTGSTATFTPDEPFTLFAMPELNVVVAGLNSTVADSHRDEDHYGWTGASQLQWFDQKLAERREDGWLRVAAVHHGEPRDADDLNRVLGRDGLAHLLLHGGGGEASSPQRPPSRLPALATGGLQYQLITVRRDGITRHARRYAPGQDRWAGDTRISASGRDWQSREPRPLAGVDSALPPEPAGKPGLPEDGPPSVPSGSGPVQPRHSFLDRVEEATRVRLGERARIVKQADRGYLRVTSARDRDGTMTQWPIGIIDGPPAEDAIDTFYYDVHRTFAAADPSLESELVYGAPAAPAELVSYALGLGIRLKSFVEYQGLVDLSGLAAKQRDKLAADRLYPERLYIEQRYRIETDGDEVCLGLVDRAVDWMAAEDARLVVVLGDFGRGKTAFLRQLTRVLPRRLPSVTPVLIELRGLEKAPRLDELLAQHLVQRGVENFDLRGLRYMIRNGRVALLFDGFDELELRVGYEHAAEYLLTLLGSVAGRAKVIVTSRTQHFQSADQVRRTLRKRVETRTGSRVVLLEEFSREQITEFLTLLYDGDRDRAQARLDLIGGIGNLLGLAHNPRMLTFIAGLGENRLRAAQDATGQVSAAGLYREIIDFWLEEETERKLHERGRPGITKQERFEACTALARLLWRSREPTIALSDLSREVASTLSDLLTERDYTEEQAAHSIASASLLIRTDDGTFAFIHRSIMEWLIAEHAARELTATGTAPMLGTRPMSRQMAAFFADLADDSAADRWAEATLASREATPTAKRNALTVKTRTSPGPSADSSGPVFRIIPRISLRGQDLRDQDLNGQNLAGADLSRANLSGMVLDRTDLTGANLRGANLAGVTMFGGSVRGATVTGSTWTHAVLLGTDDHGCATAPELSGAAVAGRDRADPAFHSTGWCTDVAYSPGGTLLAVARGAAVELADAGTGITLRVLRGHAGWVTAVAFSPDGTRIATASSDRTARIWDTATGATLATLTGHGRRINAIACSPDGTRIATASHDGTARIWDAATGTSMTTLTGHRSWVRAVAYSPDGTHLATASDDGTIKIWDVTDDTDVSEETALTGHSYWVRAVAYSPDGTHLATASSDYTARIWDTATGSTRVTFTGHSYWVNAIAYSPDGTHLATASDDRTIKIWDADGTEKVTFTGHDKRINAIAYSPDTDGTRIATASSDRTARIWDTTDSTDVQEMTTLTGHDNWIRSVTFSADGTRIATASSDRTARIWDTATGTVAVTLTGHTSWVNATAFSPDGAHLATASSDGTARIWDTTTGTAKAMLSGHDGAITAIAYSPGGTRIATASSDRTARIWDTTGAEEISLTGHNDCVRAVVYSPSGTQLATASDDRTARIWDADGSALAVLSGHGSWAHAIAYSADGTRIATGSYDGTVRIWDSTSFQPSRVDRMLRRPPSPSPDAAVEVHSSAVRSLAFHPSGNSLATASEAGTVRIWDITDITNVRERATLSGHTDPVCSIAYSPDGSLLATASDDGTVRIWDPDGEATLVTLLPFPEGGYATLLADGSYKLAGDPGDRLWWAIKLCRFAPGQLDPYVPELRKLDAGAPVIRP